MLFGVDQQFPKCISLLQEGHHDLGIASVGKENYKKVKKQHIRQKGSSRGSHVFSIIVDILDWTLSSWELLVSSCRGEVL